MARKAMNITNAPIWAQIVIPLLIIIAALLAPFLFALFVRVILWFYALCQRLMIRYIILLTRALEWAAKRR